MTVNVGCWMGQYWITHLQASCSVHLSNQREMHPFFFARHVDSSVTNFHLTTDELSKSWLLHCSTATCPMSKSNVLVVMRVTRRNWQDHCICDWQRVAAKDNAFSLSSRWYPICVTEGSRTKLSWLSWKELKHSVRALSPVSQWRWASRNKTCWCPLLACAGM